MVNLVECKFIPPLQKYHATFECDTISVLKMREIERWLVYILIYVYDININVDGILVYWILGVFIEYIEYLGITQRDKEQVELALVASVTVVIKMCFDESDWQIYADIIIPFITLTKNVTVTKHIVPHELKIITTIPLIECFRRHCPTGYQLQGLTLVKLANNDNEMNNIEKKFNGI